MKNWQTIKTRLLTDPEVKKSYDNSRVEYLLIEQIVRLRIKNKWSQQDLAEKLGTTQSALSRLETGNANPSINFLKKVASAFNSQLIIQFR